MKIEADLIRRWQEGWSIARGLPDPDPAPDVDEDGIRIHCDQPGREVEIIALQADGDPDSVARLAADVKVSQHTTWLTVPTTHPKDIETILLTSGLELLHRSEWLMTIDLDTHPRSAPAAAPYRIEVRTGKSVIQVSLYDPTDEVAAYGQMGITGTDAVADRIETLPSHRRKGLGTVVMSALAEAALNQGATTGLLIASEDGQRLYSALGWTHIADVLIARMPPEKTE